MSELEITIKLSKNEITLKRYRCDGTSDHNSFQEFKINLSDEFDYLFESVMRIKEILIVNQPSPPIPKN